MSKRILIVEDDQELQELYAAMLEDEDYQLVAAFDGSDALQRLREAPPDLIVLDIILDEVMGDAFFLQVKQQSEYADIPVVIASVLPVETCGKLLQTDARTVYLQKPFNKREFLEVVEKGLNGEQTDP